MFCLYESPRSGTLAGKQVVILGVYITGPTFIINYLIVDVNVGGYGTNPRLVLGNTVLLYIE